MTNVEKIEASGMIVGKQSCPKPLFSLSNHISFHLFSIRYSACDIHVRTYRLLPSAVKPAE